MANYPNSVYAPAAKSAGQTIQAAFFNDPDGEISAVENGLLNGLAHALTVSTGGLTVSTGAVVFGQRNVLIGSIPYVFPSSGGSVGDILTVASTGGSTMGLEWRASGAVPDAARVTLDAVFQFAGGSSIAVNWSQQTFQTNSSIHSTSVNSSRLTPQSSGIYQFFFQADVRFGDFTPGEVWIKDSSGGVIGYAPLRCNAGTGNLATSGLKYFNATGGWAKAVVKFPSTEGLTTVGSQFSMVKL